MSPSATSIRNELTSPAGFAPPFDRRVANLDSDSLIRDLRRLDIPERHRALTVVEHGEFHTQSDRMRSCTRASSHCSVSPLHSAGALSAKATAAVAGVSGGSS